MVAYRRMRRKGAIYFFTLVLADRRSQWLITHVGSVAKALRETRAKHQFENIAMVVLPEHIHMMWELVPVDKDFPKLIRCFKSQFTKELIRKKVLLTKDNRGRYNVWQPRYWEHVIGSDDDFEKHFNYIHYTPVKHGHVNRVVDWPYSSFHRYVKAGVLMQHWAGAVGGVREDICFGEI